MNGHDVERKARKGFFAVLAAFALYVVATLVLTWPLARGLTHDIPGDFGDPLFTMWVLSWDLTHLGSGWWNANIFHPHPLALAYSEHDLPQALSIAPVYFLTHNPILCYNLLFLSTFVLSGVGMYLFARELTGSPEAALVGGFAYAFAPYRIGALPHLQVLSSAWLPFALFGLRRYFSTGRWRPLAGAMAAWFLQNLSCGYYLFFFSPIVALYLAWELTARRLWSDARVVGRVVAASAVTLAATAWFIQPYAELRRLGFKPRDLAEVQYYSADVYAYLTADPNLRLWGPIAQAWPHAEGHLFPGATIAALAAIAVAASWRRARAARHQAPASRWIERATAAVGWALVAACGFVLYLLVGYELRTAILKVTSFARHVWIAVILSVTLLAISARARHTARAWFASPAGCLSLIALFAVVMSFGPVIQTKGDLVTHTSLYSAFYHDVPGFDGLRVPARFAMAVTLALAGLSALAIAAVAPEKRRRLAALTCVCMAIEAAALPIPINQNPTGYQQRGLVPLPPSVAVGAAVPEIYKRLSELPSSTVVVELPLGEPAFDIRYMFYSTNHWKRLVNGYSGGMPVEYESLIHALQAPNDRAWGALADSGATHAIVHEGFYMNGAGARLSSWFRSRGAQEISAFGEDHLFHLR